MTHSPLAIQALLRAGGPAALEALHIKARPHAQFPNLICFKYNQRLSPMNEPAVREARGLILDADEDWAVVSMSFQKFFNLEEPSAADIDWDTAVVEEKLDGSLLCLYFYAGEWRVQSSGTADASGAVVQNIKESVGGTYQGLFWHTFTALGYQLPPPPEELGTRYTFAFELMSLANRVVIEHPTPRLVLHGARNLGTLEEEDAQAWATRLGYEAATTYSLTRDTLRAEADALSGLESEGFVVRDAAFRRVKVKNAHYVQLALLKDVWSKRRAAEIVLAGEESEFAGYFPEFAAELRAAAEAIETVLEDIEHAYAAISHIEGQKDFAMQAKDHWGSAALFALRAGKHANAREWLLSLGEAARGRVLEAGNAFFREEAAGNS